MKLFQKIKEKRLEQEKQYKKLDNICLFEEYTKLNIYDLKMTINNNDISLVVEYKKKRTL